MSLKPIFAFVLMPFNPGFDDVYKIGIKEAAAKVGINAERLDEQMFVEGMLERIYRQIETADIIIADMSGKNPNVFYEVGYAHGKDKLYILITENADDIPFDLKHRRHIVYGNSLSFLRDELVKNLEWAKSEIKNVRKTQIRVETGITGHLETNEIFAKGFIEHTFDLYNDSSRSSPEIHSIYFYTGSDWAYNQNKSECPKTVSDLDPYSNKYYLVPPVTRLAPKSWAQIKISGSRILAAKWKGDEIKNKYAVAGKTVLRFITSDGVFDYEINLNVELEEFPF